MLTDAYLLFQIFYNEEPVYVGHSKRPLLTTLHNIFFKPPMTRTVDILQVSKIRYIVFDNESDMLLYETYLLLRDKPRLNRGYRADGLLVVTLPEIPWKEVDAHTLSDLQMRMVEQLKREREYGNRYHAIYYELGMLLIQERNGEICAEEYQNRTAALKQEQKSLERKLWG